MISKRDLKGQEYKTLKANEYWGSPKTESVDLGRSLSTDILSEILRHFTRKELCLKLYSVNRRFYRVATSPYDVPTIHILKEMKFRVIRNNAKKKPQSIVTVDGWLSNIELPKDLKSMGYPGPFIRFSTVRFENTVDVQMEKFLRKIRPESLVGCKLHFHSCEITARILYLLDNVVQNPYSVKFCGNPLRKVKQMFQTKGISNCNKVELWYKDEYLRHGVMLHTSKLVIIESISALTNWLKNSTNLENKSSQIAKRRLKLLHFPKKFCLNMVNHFRQDFKDAAESWPEFVVTFGASYLDKVNEFRETKQSTGNRLSFFKLEYSHFASGSYRIWHRRVVSEEADSTMLSYLRRPGNAKKDMTYYWLSYEYSTFLS
ncbi:hypothetical protein Ddc_15005 [Ditylenchus destructor]|nr:hypothetical protein Ddc_15005 [Ditylenchus destructor]